MKRDELLALLRQYMGTAGDLGDKLVNQIISQINAGKPLSAAIDAAMAATGFNAAYINNLIESICSAALLSYGIKTPSMEMKTAVRQYILADAWAPDKMKLSKRLHGTSKQMRTAIVDTIAAAMRKGKAVKQLSMDLYDGYNSGKKVLRGAELPQYLNRMVVAARSAAGGDRNILGEFNRAVKAAQKQLAKTNQPDKALRVAYQNLIDAAQKLNQKALEKAAWVAVQEKARYYADRIATTEMSRAWSDSFYAQNYDDPDVVGYGWRLSSNHPVFDICDFHAGVDLYGMGAGNYPKDKVPPHPAHPFCRCNLVVLYRGEVTVGKFNPDAAAAWLKAQSMSDRQKLLGVAGSRQFEQDGKWQKHLRNWQGHVDPKPRLKVQELKSYLQQSKDNGIIRENMINAAEQIRKQVLEDGPEWKPGKLEKHVEKRKNRGHIPQGWTDVDYNSKILEILNSKDVDTYLYHKNGFVQNFFVYAHRKSKWMVMIGENGIMETAYIIDQQPYDEHLSIKEGYTKMGTIGGKGNAD
ncbi:hypothetical protein HSX37_16215|uniref:Phage Mu protein F like protein n=1 Tax=Dendrosporobacter quercicolus TaxID=146817 RepID=A0A1G9ZQW9_9FIRM|nr:hypothetical protein [Dendrosporobacter quercicolus]NSL49581.1 hypothetical protein [Dendrosporobacter quercicolus DSM 1736]SDN23584.1 hypothetical protein SAMN04488502_11537 [Dendrosporobacter quercicolus]